jgi:hypothetical protein
MNLLVSLTLYRTGRGTPFRSSCSDAMLPGGPTNLAATLPKGTLETGHPSTEIRMSPIWILPLSEAGLLGLMDTTCVGSTRGERDWNSVTGTQSDEWWKIAAMTEMYIYINIYTHM